ncbi:MAG: isocitrate/isopropylmalate dehydrogenase family protein [Shimia sp.]
MAADLTLLALPGDGIGPEIVTATRAVIEAAAPLCTRHPRLETAEIGWAALERHGTTIPETVIAQARTADGVILGPVSHADYPAREEGGLNPSGVLRRAFDLHANVRPARAWPGVPGREGTDLVIFRENLEGFYADRNMHVGPGEYAPVEGVALATRRITARESRRIAEAAFAHAETRPRKHVTIVHKANVLRLTCGLFRDTVRDVARAHPAVTVDEMLVDAAAAHLVRDPARFDVIVTTNMFGDILSDLASELAGGLGLAASLNAGPNHAMAQAQHGSAPDLAGMDRANPTSLFLSAAMLLRQLGEGRAADAIETAIGACLAAPATRTADLGGALGTRAFARAVAARLT